MVTAIVERPLSSSTVQTKAMDASTIGPFPPNLHHAFLGQCNKIRGYEAVLPTRRHALCRSHSHERDKDDTKRQFAGNVQEEKDEFCYPCLLLRELRQAFRFSPAAASPRFGSRELHRRVMGFANCVSVVTNRIATTSFLIATISLSRTA